MSSSRPVVTLLDYGVGNVQSVRNAIHHAGYDIHDVTSPKDIENAKVLIFPGVGRFDMAMKQLEKKQLVEPLRAYLRSGRPFFGICVGMQVLFERGTEGDAEGLGIIPGVVDRFQTELSVPHIGWNGVKLVQQSDNKDEAAIFTQEDEKEKFYFVHSYRVLPTERNASWVRGVTDYGERFVCFVQKGAIMASQFHPEKSSKAGLNLMKRFLDKFVSNKSENQLAHSEVSDSSSTTQLSKRIIACLDVRTNDDGDLVVTKGDQYDVREKAPSNSSSATSDGQSSPRGQVRNLGKPVELARRYYEEGADEVTFLNITSYRGEVLADVPMIAVLEQTSKHVFVPLCIGGGIRDYTDAHGHTYTALQVADQYFRSGADKVSIGSDAVIAAQEFIANGRVKTGKSSIEQISNVYGVQAVVVSIDPKRHYVTSPDQTTHATVKLTPPQVGPNGEEYCWYQCTIKGGRETVDLDVVQLSQAVEALGAGELLLNSMDQDGMKNGFDCQLIQMVCSAVSIPVIASSGAGSSQHFVDVFQKTSCQAALAAGIFHRREVPLQDVKNTVKQAGIPTRT